MSTRKYDSTVARIAGNILSGYVNLQNSLATVGDNNSLDSANKMRVKGAVLVAREIVRITKETEPEPES